MAIDGRRYEGVTFTHFDPDTKAQTHFAVTLLLKVIEVVKPQVYIVPLEADGAEMIRKVRGIERHRYKRLRPPFHPLLFVEMPDKTHLLIDGNHRYLWLWNHGRREAQAYILPELIWRHFEVVNVPELPEDQVINSYSGIL